MNIKYVIKSLKETIEEMKDVNELMGFIEYLCDEHMLSNFDIDKDGNWIISIFIKEGRLMFDVFKCDGHLKIGHKFITSII